MNLIEPEVDLMVSLYTDQHRQAIRTQLSRRAVPLGIFSAVMLGVVVWSLIGRHQALTIAAVILLGAGLIFACDVFLKPLWQYSRFLSSALTGRSHTDSLVFDHPEPDISLVDGVACRSLVFLGTPDKHGVREQMLYWDSQIPLPDFKPGEDLLIQYTGKMIIGYESL